MLNESRDDYCCPVEVDGTTSVGQYETENVPKALIAMTGKVCYFF